MKQHEIMKSIEKTRRELGYKQYEFSEMMGMSACQYSKMKNNKRVLYGFELFNLAIALNIKVSALIRDN